MKHLFFPGLLLTLLGWLTSASAQTYDQHLELAATRLKAKDYCGATASFRLAFADSTTIQPFDLFAGAGAAANCPGQQALALRWLLRLPYSPRLPPLTAHDVDNMAQEGSLSSLHDQPAWTSFLSQMRAVAARQAAATAQAATAWVTAAEGRALPLPNAGRFAGAQPGGALYYAPSDTVRQPYLVYVPRSYRPEVAAPLLVHLHGGVSNTQQFQFRDPNVLEEPIFAAAAARGALVLYPFGRHSFGWLKQVAALENVRRMVAQVQRRYRVDPARVYLGGMSNGGTAAFWYACQRPAGFAGFYALSATPTSALGPLNFRRLSRGAPLYSLNAEDDQVFPFQEVRAIYEQHRAEAAQWHFASRPGGGHGFLYGPAGPATLTDLLTQLMGPPPPKP